jgi:hypothetical protein
MASIASRTGAAQDQPNWRGAVEVEIASLIIDDRLLRHVDEATVAEYAALMADGVHFPPVEAVRTDVGSFLTDGHHRTEAAKRCDEATFPARVKDGEWDDVVEAAAAANATHGRRRTANEQRMAVRILLGLSKWSRMSDREIARHCRVSHPTVAAVRADILRHVESPFHVSQAAENIDADLEPEAEKPSERRIGADGKAYDVSGIVAANRRRREEPDREIGYAHRADRERVNRQAEKRERYLAAMPPPLDLDAIVTWGKTAIDGDRKAAATALVGEIRKADTRWSATTEIVKTEFAKVSTVWRLRLLNELRAMLNPAEQKELDAWTERI